MWHRSPKKPKASALSRKIVALLKAEGVDFGVSADLIYIKRTRAGYWQRTVGAWSWYLDADESVNSFTRVKLQSYGSCEPASEIALFGIGDIYNGPGGFEIFRKWPRERMRSINSAV